MKFINLGQKLSAHTIDDIITQSAQHVGWTVHSETQDTKRVYTLFWDKIQRGVLSCNALSDRGILIEAHGIDFFGTVRRFETQLQHAALDSLEKWPYASGTEVVASFAEHCPYYQSLVPALDKAFERAYSAFVTIWDRKERILDAYDAFVTTDIDTKTPAKKRKGPRAREIDTERTYWQLDEISPDLSEPERILVSVRTVHKKLKGAYSFTEALAKYRALSADQKQTVEHHLREYYFHESARGAEYEATRDKTCMSDGTRYIDPDRQIRETDKAYQLERMLQTLNMYQFMGEIIRTKI